METFTRIEHGGAPVHKHGKTGRWHGPWENHKDASLHEGADKPTWEPGHGNAADKALYAKALAGTFKVNWTARAAGWRKAGGKGYMNDTIPRPREVSITQDAAADAVNKAAQEAATLEAATVAAGLR